MSHGEWIQSYPFNLITCFILSLQADPGVRSFKILILHSCPLKCIERDLKLFVQRSVNHPSALGIILLIKFEIHNFDDTVFSNDYDVF